MKPLLDVKGIEVAYGKILAVKGIDLEVHEGEVVSLIGANGAGKSTTLRAISGLIRARAGEILFDAHPIQRMSAHRIARLGLVQVPEGRQIFIDMSVLENLRMGAYGEGRRAVVKQRLELAMDLFPRLAERRGQVAGLLSGGEQQMLAMGRALMAEPRVLLLDEPSMGLAPRLVDEIFELILRLKREQRTILLVEQNANLALEVSDRAYVLETGRMRLSGPATKVASDPAVLAAYLGSH